MKNVGPNFELIGEPGSRLRLQTPALIIDLDTLERNITQMADYCHQHGIALRPHAKTHKSIKIAQLQIEAGAIGICTATLGEAEVMVHGGISNVLITTPAIGPAKIARLLDLNQTAEGLMVVVDDPENLNRLAEATETGEKILQVVVAFDVGNRRIGLPTVEQVVVLARRISQAKKLMFAGVHAYTGVFQHIEDYEQRSAMVASENARIAKLKTLLVEAGMPPSIITGAGTGTHEIDTQSGVFTELQTGSYIFTDVEYNVVALRRESSHPFEPSLFVRTMVVSANHDGFVTTDAGIKRFSMGGAAPEIVSGAPADSIYDFMGDEHGKIIFNDPGFRLPVGSIVELIPPHCDPTVNLYDVYHIVRGDTLVDIWPVDARGVI